jgi:Mn-dependent DtxR family transcriptional regulator
LEYRKCTVTGVLCHYTEFNKAAHGWLAVDGSKRHSQSKLGKKINRVLYHNLSVVVEGQLVGIGHENHPYTKLYYSILEEIRQSNPEYGKGRNAKLTKEAYIQLHQELGMEIPDLEKAKNNKSNRQSNISTTFLDYAGVPNDDKHREVKIGRYHVDGLVGKTIFEFYGDFFHANPQHYEPNDKIFGFNAKEKWKRDQERTEFLKSLGYTVVVVWESDWRKYQLNTSDTNKLRMLVY